MAGTVALSAWSAQPFQAVSTVEYVVQTQRLPAWVSLTAPRDSSFIAGYEGRHGDVVIVGTSTGRGDIDASFNFYLSPAGASLPGNAVLELVGVAQVAPNRAPLLIFRVIAFFAQ